MPVTTKKAIDKVQQCFNQEYKKPVKKHYRKDNRAGKNSKKIFM